MNYRRTVQLATALAAAAALAACSGGSDAPAPTENTVNAMELTEDLPVENVAEPEPVVTENTTAPAPVAEAPVQDDEQILDDAESVGMTARVDRSGGTTNQAAPAE